MSKWINYAGEICTSKAGSKYVKITKDFKVFKGQKIWLKKYSDYQKELKDKDFIDETELEKRLGRKWISYVLNISPQDAPGKYDMVDRNEWANEVIDIRENGDGNYFIEVKKSFPVKKGDIIFLNKVTDQFKEMLEKGIITDEKFKQMTDSIKMKDDDGNILDRYWLHFRGTLPPQK